MGAFCGSADRETAFLTSPLTARLPVCREAQGAPTPSPSKLSSATVRADLVVRARGGAGGGPGPLARLQAATACRLCEGRSMLPTTPLQLVVFPPFAPQAQIRGLAEACGAVPDICKRRAPGEADPTLGAQVGDPSSPAPGPAAPPGIFYARRSLEALCSRGSMLETQRQPVIIA